MASSINLEDMPQLVLDKVTSFLYLKDLLTLEQISRKLKCAVDAHFSITDNLTIGYLPELEQEIRNDEAIAKDKKCLDGLLKIIKRCGIRLRTIHVLCLLSTGTTSIENYKMYFQHIFASAEMIDNCPNIENIIAFPQMDIISILDHNMFRQQNILLNAPDTEFYAKKIKLKGETCKLRSIRLYTTDEYEGDEGETHMDDFYKRVLNLYSNLEQIAVDDDEEDDFVKFLPQFIKKGLKDLRINGLINIPNVKKYCNIGKDLRTLHITISLESDNDIIALNEVQLTENLVFEIRSLNVDDGFTKLSENVCNKIIGCDMIELTSSTNCRSLSKLKNLKDFEIPNMELFKAIAEGSFPELKRISSSNLCDSSENCHIELHRSSCSCRKRITCNLQRFLPQLLINKGNQLIFIDILTTCYKSVDLFWKSLKHCKAAKVIEFGCIFLDWPSTVTYEDVKAICSLPNLQLFSFRTMKEKIRTTPWRKHKREDDHTCYILPELVERAAAEHADLQFKYGNHEKNYSLYRIHF